MKNVLDMSDDEILNMSDSDFEESPTEEKELETESEVDSDDDESAQADSSQEEETDEDEVEEQESEDPSEQEQEETIEPDVDDEKEETQETADTKTESSVDYEAAYKKLTAPFKANGREMRIENVDEAIQLMQMGANYNKKMASLKPGLKILRMLEDHKLLDEAKLSYLIDLDKRDPKAITKLIKDSGINPLDVDVENDTDYQPKSYTVDDKALELDAVLDEISSTSAYTQTVDVISNKWDNESKKVLLNNPAAIKTINEHIESGIYAQVVAVVEKERMLGRLTGLSDLDAYDHVGRILANEGKLTGLGSAPQPHKAPIKNPVVPTKPKVSEDPSLKQRKQAAALTQSKSAGTKATEDFNPLSLSDEEFMKIAASKFA
jgi:hypothetical protein